jgi:molybdopterin/thiamine biosynthesis adenylyltransferase
MPIYVDSGNIASLIPDESIVVLCVDNNKTRHLVQEHCLTLKNIILVNGGNETYDGDVTVFRKHEGEILLPPIWEGQDQILNPVDKHPSDKSCEERYEIDPQLFITNCQVANDILQFLTPVVLKKETLWRRKWFDIRTGSRVESDRKVGELLQFQLS